jgi:CheY-like chemotaxis protein
MTPNPLKILFVDNEDYIRECFKSLVEMKCKAKVTTAVSALHALNILKNHKFDILITDIVMPEMDGIRLTEIVRKKYDLPVVLITGYASDDLLPLGLEEHAVCCISKPYTLSEVKEKVYEALEKFGNNNQKKEK